MAMPAVLVVVQADDGVGGANRELWKSDGTDAGTMQVVDLLPGVSSSMDSQPMAALDGLVYFGADDDPGGGFVKDLWRSDGTPEGTEKVLELDAAAKDAKQLADEVIAHLRSAGKIG